MVMDSSDAVELLAGFVRARTVSGLWSTPGPPGPGLPVGFGDDGPSEWLTPDEVEQRIGAVPDDALRRRMQLRLALGPFRGHASRERQQLLNDDLDLTPAERRGPHYRSPRPTRTVTDELSREIARAVLRTSAPAESPDHDYVRELYLRSVLLPPGNVGVMTEVHQRIIRSRIHGLDRFVVHQSEHWNTTVTADAHAMGDVDIRTLRVRRDSHNGITGERLDLELRFPPMKRGERRELRWIRTRMLGEGWLPEDRSFVFAYVPDRPTEKAVIEIKFGNEAPPASVFRFADVYEADRLEADIPMEVVHPRHGAIRCEWPAPALERASGVRVWW